MFCKYNAEKLKFAFTCMDSDMVHRYTINEKKNIFL